MLYKHKSSLEDKEWIPGAQRKDGPHCTPTKNPLLWEYTYILPSSPKIHMEKNPRASGNDGFEDEILGNQSNQQQLLLPLNCGALRAGSPHCTPSVWSQAQEVPGMLEMPQRESLRHL